MQHLEARQTEAAGASGRWLAAARVVWMAVVAMAVALFIAGVPIIARELRTPCDGASCYRWQASPRLAADLAGHGLSLEWFAAYKIAMEVVLLLGFGSIAAILVLRRPNEPMALLAALTLVAFGASFVDPIHAVTLSAPFWRWSYTLLACLGWSSLFVFFYLFPSGRFVPRWTRVAAVAWCGFVALAYLCPPDWPVSTQEVTSATARSSSGGPLFSIGVLAFFATVVCAQIYRYRRISTPIQRQQTKWVVCGFIAAFGGLAVIILAIGPLLPSFGPTTVATAIIYIAGFHGILLLLPVSLAIAILRHRLYDIDIIVNRTLVYGALTACVVAFYVLSVGSLGSRLHAGGNLAVSLAVTGLIAVLFQSLRERLQRGVNRLMYGERDEPYTVLSRLGQRLEGTLAADAVLPVICRTVTEALKLPYAAIALRQDGGVAVAAASGTPTVDPLCLPLVYQNEPVGELRLAPRTPGGGFGPADRRLLDDLARQAGVAAHAVRLTADLQRSRERLVLAREEERRRLRRDLHDGLGPMLGSLTLKLSVADDLLDRDLAAAHALIDGLKTQTQTAIADIRRLVYALRPPALDELGLTGALCEAAGQFGQSGPQIIVDAPERLPSLPAAVEVAAYRIVQEALTNVVRHARARQCLVRIAFDAGAAALCLEIRDDGQGIPAARGLGMGLTSMRERAEELGGTCAVNSPPAGGTHVRAALPCGRPGGVDEPASDSDAVPAIPVRGG